MERVDIFWILENFRWHAANDGKWPQKCNNTMHLSGREKVTEREKKKKTKDSNMCNSNMNPDLVPSAIIAHFTLSGYENHQ